jgi:hypothetical protein
MGRSSSPVGYGIGIAEVVGSNPTRSILKLVLNRDSRIVGNRKMTRELIEFESDPYSLFIFAINSPLTKAKYVARLNKFPDFINLSGALQERCRIFAEKSSPNLHGFWIV